MKRIRSRDDLAIFGGSPAFSEPLHVGRPNIGSRELFYLRLEEAFQRGWFTNNGPLVCELEEKIKDYLGVRNCVAITNGTIALEIAIKAMGFTGEVIVPSFTFIATAHAVQWQGLTPVFADIDPGTHNIDPESVREKITDRTSGIIAVNLWGRPADDVALTEVAREFGLGIVYDSAHSFGCSRDGVMIGNFGSMEVLSFHATKFFNSFEGGAIVTNDDDIAEKVKLMRNFGFSGYDNVICGGTNGKMTEVCAAMGLANLEGINDVIETNYRNYNAYKSGIGGISGVSLVEFDEEERNNFQYIVLEVSEEYGLSRDELIEALHAENVLARRYFWPGCHKMMHYKDAKGASWNNLAYTDRIASRVVVLPTGSAVSIEDIEIITNIIRRLPELARG